MDADRFIQSVPRSPCLLCEFVDEDKSNDRCENCEDRLEYVKNFGSKSSIDTIVEMSAKDLPVRKRDVRYCDTPNCNKIHYAGGLCKSCYYKKRHMDGKDAKRAPSRTSVTLHFTRISGGKDILAALQEIAYHEDRAVTKQAIRFICDGILRWYDEHASG